MLKWIEEKVESPYGAVRTLNWAVDENAATVDAADEFHNDNRQDMPELDSAQDELGSVLWNSNTAALNHLHRHVFQEQIPIVAPNTRAARKLRPRSQRAIERSEHDPKVQSDASNDSSSSSDEECDKRCHVLELGAGVGCLGIALAKGGASTLITDIKELTPLMGRNIALNRLSITQGGGTCQAVAWRWGPPAHHHIYPKSEVSKSAQRKSLKKQREQEEALVKSRGSEAIAKGQELEGDLPPILLALNGAASEGFAEVRRRFQDRIDYVVLCDALYGNPRHWPALIYTLTEILTLCPSCQIINFCEQRVEGVEDDFLKLLELENTRWQRHHASSPPAASPRAAGPLLNGEKEWGWSLLPLEESSQLSMTVRVTRIYWAPKGQGGDATGSRSINAVGEEEAMEGGNARKKSRKE